MGSVFDIMHFSTRDGPGIRTTVFFKGCPLACLWCHNPESQSAKPELMFRPNLCIGCGECVDACEQDAIRMEDGLPLTDRELCILCASCSEVCSAEARVVVGCAMSVAQVLAEIEKDVVFYDESGGGVTFSGGEALLQRDFLAALLHACREKGISTALDTSGFAAWPVLESVLPLVDLFLYDLKAVDEETHRRFTGVSNRLILDNLRRLSQQGARIILRLPLIPGVNDSPSDLQAAAELASTLPHLEKMELLPYHEAGVEKYHRLGRSYGLEETRPHTSLRLAEIAQSLQSYHLNIQVGG